MLDARRADTAPLDESGAGARIIGLDGLRAVSVLLVLFGHGWSKLPFATEFAWAGPYLGNASLGVQTFFVLSGFLITHLLRSEASRTGTIWLAGFYARRVLRIFPAMYAFLFVLLILRGIGRIHTTLGDLFIAGTFLTNYKHLLPIRTNDDYWYVGNFWTLALEEQFYIFWPVTVLTLGLLRARYAALAIVVASPLIRVISYFAWPSLRPQLGMMLHTAADPIMFGCLAALWTGGPRFELALRRCSGWYVPAASATFMYAVSPWLALRFSGTYVMTVGITLNSIAITVLMLWVIRRRESLLTRFLACRAMTRIGVLSYSLYLWQQLFLNPSVPRWSTFFPFEFVACFAAAELSYRLIESPALRLRTRFRRDAPPAASRTVEATS